MCLYVVRYSTILYYTVRHHTVLYVTVLYVPVVRTGDSAVSLLARSVPYLSWNRGRERGRGGRGIGGGSGGRERGEWGGRDGG